MFSKNILEFSAIVFSTILAIMIEIKIFRWCFQLYKNGVFELELEMHHDVFFFVILIWIFVSWILGRALWHFHYKKNPIPQRIVHGTTIEILRTLSLFFSLSFFFSESFLERVDCAGSDSGAGSSTAFPKLEWERALDLPENHIAPECLRSHIKEELRYPFNIGRKTTLSHTIFDTFIEPFNIDKASVGFCKALLERVNSLQEEQISRSSRQDQPCSRPSFTSAYFFPFLHRFYLYSMGTPTDGPLYDLYSMGTPTTIHYMISYIYSFLSFYGDFLEAIPVFRKSLGEQSQSQTSRK